MKEKTLAFALALSFGCSMHAIGFYAGQKAARAEYAEKFPHVENFQPTLIPAKYGDLMLIGTEEHPCEEPPCVDMWNGKTWVKLVPE